MKYYLIDFIQEGGVKTSDLNSQGIQNIGNKCYFNASLQLIYHIVEFRDFLINIQWQYVKDSIAYNFIELLKNMKNININSVIGLENKVGTDINTQCSINEFGVGAQASADELLSKIFENINITLGKNNFNGPIEIYKNGEIIKKYKKNDPRSWFAHTGEKQFFNKKDNKYLKSVQEPYDIYYNVSIYDSHNDLQKNIDKSSEATELEGYKYYHDEGKQLDESGNYDMIDTALVKYSYKYNKYVLIKIKAEQFDKHTGKTIKSNYNLKNINKILMLNSNKYELIGCIEHIPGHYTCYIYNSDKDIFIHYDDSGRSETTNGHGSGDIVLVAYRLIVSNDEEYKKIYTPILDNLLLDQYFKEIREPTNIIELICDILDD